MLESRPPRLTSAEFIDRLNSDAEFVFKGERFTIPANLPDSLMRHDGRLFEVSAEKLISVAQHIARGQEASGETISRAYQLICEAEVFSRNLSHWNGKADRHHVAKSIHEIVTTHTIKSGKNKGRVPRLDLIAAFLKSNNRESNRTFAGKIFNEWIRETLRHRSFEAVVPHLPMTDSEAQLYIRMQEKGWIRWLSLHGNGHLVVPSRTEKPKTRSRKKLSKGQHETQPWWGTKTTWWPNPSKGEIKAFRQQYLCNRDQYFQDTSTAGRALEKFARWLQIKDAIAEQFRDN